MTDPRTYWMMIIIFGISKHMLKVLVYLNDETKPTIPKRLRSIDVRDSVTANIWGSAYDARHRGQFHVNADEGNPSTKRRILACDCKMSREMAGTYESERKKYRCQKFYGFDWRSFNIYLTPRGICLRKPESECLMAEKDPSPTEEEMVSWGRGWKLFT